MDQFSKIIQVIDDKIPSDKSNLHIYISVPLILYSGVPNKRTGTLINFQKKMHLVRSY